MRSIKRTSIATAVLCAALNAHLPFAAAADGPRYPSKVVRLLALGIEPVGSTPAQFTEHLNKEIARWTPIIQKAGIKPD